LVIEKPAIEPAASHPSSQQATKIAAKDFAVMRGPSCGVVALGNAGLEEKLQPNTI
jgi:hypothetical protein